MEDGYAPRPSQLVMVALVLLSVASVLGYAISQLSSDHLTGRIDSSWIRTASIRMGLTLNSDPLNVAVGVGPGQSSPIIKSHWSGPPIPKIQVDVAIWSVAVRYYAETGLLGAAALLAVLGMAVGAVARSSAVLLGLCARLVARRRGRNDELLRTVACLAVPRRGALLGSVVPPRRLDRGGSKDQGSPHRRQRWIMKKIKVVHIINWLNYGGAEVMLCNLLASTDRERFELMMVVAVLIDVLPLAERVEAWVFPCGR